jgi:hypothetical protein
MKQAEKRDEGGSKEEVEEGIKASYIVSKARSSPTSFKEVQPSSSPQEKEHRPNEV